MPSTPFQKLSSALTGERRLDEGLSHQFEARITVQYGPLLTELLKAFEGRLKSGEPERAIKDVLEDSKADSTGQSNHHPAWRLAPHGITVRNTRAVGPRGTGALGAALRVIHRSRRPLAGSCRAEVPGDPGAAAPQGPRAQHLMRFLPRAL